MRQLVVSVRSDFQSPIVKSCDTTRVPGRRPKDFRPQFHVDARQQIHGQHGRLREIGFEQILLPEGDPVGDAGALGVELRIPDPCGIELDAERPRAEPARGDGDAAVAGSEIDHEIRGPDFGDLQHAVHGLPRGRNIDDVQTLRVDIGDSENADANQESGREHSPGDGRSCGLTHAVLVTWP